MIEYLSFSEAGHGHGNEDRIEAVAHPADGSVLLCSLADGQGGRAGGALAASIAVAESVRAAQGFTPEELANPSVWRAIGYSADRAVSDHAEAGYTTLVTLAASHEAIVGCSSGDSSALLVAGERSVVLTEQQRKNPPVGSLAAEWTPFRADLTGGWKLLLTSDGVWKYVGWEVMLEACMRHAGRELVEALRRAASERVGRDLPDDFSLVLVEASH